MQCELCTHDHNGSYGSGRFCSERCSRSFSTKTKRAQINERVSKKLQNPAFVKRCIGCSIVFSTKKKRQKYHSRLCTMKNSSKVESTREKNRQAQLKLVSEGRHAGWKSRKGKTPLYAESYFIAVLQNATVRFEREKSEGSYFIDFALDGKIALEIDGKQHLDPVRVEHDRQKDEFLRSRGWNVVRIAWKNPISENARSYLYEQIKNLMVTLRGVG